MEPAYTRLAGEACKTGEPVEVRLGTDERLRIYHRGRLVGEHAMAPAGSPPRDDPRHAEARRRLRQRPTGSRPRDGGPRFEQRLPKDVLPAWIGEAPIVAQRPLVAYEVAP